MDEVCELARLTEISRKQRVAQRYNVKVVKREFGVNDFVLCRAGIGQTNAKDGKLAVNCEGPYRIIRSTRKGAYALETLQGRELPRTFNAMTYEDTIVRLAFIFPFWMLCLRFSLSCIFRLL